MTHDCIKCGAPLIVGENTTQKQIDLSQYTCRSCKQKYDREYRQKHLEQCQKHDQEYRQKHREHHRNWAREYKHRMGIQHPMSENRNCASFLGVYVAERVLTKVFKNVERMPYSNPGFDFICGGGHNIDVKSACISVDGRWGFSINRNKIADYFLCIAFDNREDLNPLHAWLIPGKKVNHLKGASIRPHTIHKWDEYKLDVEKVVACCNTMKTK